MKVCNAEWMTGNMLTYILTHFRNDYYGVQWASFNLRGIQQWVEEVTAPPSSIPPGEYFNLPSLMVDPAIIFSFELNLVLLKYVIIHLFLWCRNLYVHNFHD